MAEWSVHIDADGGTSFGDPEAEAVIDALAAQAPVVSHGQGDISVRFNVEAGSARDAVDKALAVFSKTCPALEVFRVEAQTVEGLEQELGVADIPELVGVAELATLLGVSKQRASELARGTGFPAPLAVLAAGPIWPAGNVLRYVRRWKRRPGRPRKGVRATKGAPAIRAKEHDSH